MAIRGTPATCASPAARVVLPLHGGPRIATRRGPLRRPLIPTSGPGRLLDGVETCRAGLPLAGRSGRRCIGFRRRRTDDERLLLRHDSWGSRRTNRKRTPAERTGTHVPESGCVWSAPAD